MSRCGSDIYSLQTKGLIKNQGSKLTEQSIQTNGAFSLIQWFNVNLYDEDINTVFLFPLTVTLQSNYRLKRSVAG